MKIKGETEFRVFETEVEDYVVSELNGESYDRGQIEAIEKTGENTVEAFGRLIDVLATKGLLDAKEIMQIIGDYDYDGVELIR